MTHIQQRIDYASVWEQINPTLLDGEVGWERETRRQKLGDGMTPWNSLPYVETPGGGGGEFPEDYVESINGKTGAVLLTKADIGLSKVDNTTDAEKRHSPALTGTPTAPTPAPGSNNNQIATTAFVMQQVGSGVGGGLTSLEFYFAAPSTQWVCEHGLGQRLVDVTIMDANGAKITGDVTYLDSDTVVLNWYYPMTGTVLIQERPEG